MDTTVNYSSFTNMHNNWTFFMTDLITERRRIFYAKLSQLVKWKMGDILMW